MVMEHIKKKLSQCLPDVDINTQIICLSTTKALAAQKYEIRICLTYRQDRLFGFEKHRNKTLHWENVLERRVVSVNCFVSYSFESKWRSPVGESLSESE